MSTCLFTILNATSLIIFDYTKELFLASDFGGVYHWSGVPEFGGGGASLRQKAGRQCAYIGKAGKAWQCPARPQCRHAGPQRRVGSRASPVLFHACAIGKKCGGSVSGMIGPVNNLLTRC